MSPQLLRHSQTFVGVSFPVTTVLPDRFLPQALRHRCAVQADLKYDRFLTGYATFSLIAATFISSFSQLDARELRKACSAPADSTSSSALAETTSFLQLYLVWMGREIAE